ncbi:MAG: hypothetical protein KF724_02185 [Phycisphaeraceae bacterium]|nr:hypothetical protein [Phycisphaeraceae bacterium]
MNIDRAPDGDFFESCPLRLINWLASAIDADHWRLFCDQYSADPPLADELLRLREADRNRPPEFSVDAYDALHAMPHHIAMGMSRELPHAGALRLEAFAISMSLSAELRGQVVADTPWRSILRLIELCDQIGGDCLRPCGDFIMWMRVHVERDRWRDVMCALSALVLVSAASHAATNGAVVLRDLSRFHMQGEEWRQLPFARIASDASSRLTKSVEDYNAAIRSLSP